VLIFKFSIIIFLMIFMSHKFYFVLYQTVLIFVVFIFKFVI